MDIKKIEIPAWDVKQNIKFKSVKPPFAQISRTVAPTVNSLKKMTFDCRLSSNGSYMRQVGLRMTIPLKLEINNEKSALTNGSRFFSRANDFSQAPFPIHQLIETISVQIGNEKIKHDIGPHLNPLLYYKDDSSRVDKFRTHASFRPIYANNNDSYLSFAHSLDSYNDSILDKLCNGAWPTQFVNSAGVELKAGDTYVSNGSNIDVGSTGLLITNDSKGNRINDYVVYLNFTSSEFLLFDVLNRIFKDENQKDPGITGSKLVKIELTFRNDPRWALHSGSAENDTTFTNVSYRTKFINPELYFIEMKPKKGYVQPTFMRQYFNFQNYITNHTVSLAPRSTTTLSKIIKPNVIPHFLLLFIKPTDSEYDFSDNKYNLVIDRLVIKYHQTDGILAEYNQEQLFHLCKKNALYLDYTSFTGTLNCNASSGAQTHMGMGSMILLNMSEDLAYNSDNLTAGLISNDIQLTVTVKNSKDNLIPLNVTDEGDPRTVTTAEFVCVSIEQNVLLIKEGVCKTYSVL